MVLMEVIRVLQRDNDGFCVAQEDFKLSEWSGVSPDVVVRFGALRAGGTDEARLMSSARIAPADVIKEFRCGIKKANVVIREVASKAVKDLPNSLQAGVGLDRESLESVGQAINDLGIPVSGIVAQGKEYILAIDYYIENR
ncbi:hypothetical protein E3N88_18940 [Mikania micrantha]|uniref:Uncharacterized protein n=1 Tax=Mikania micrantha TaxID=192012 RepID=A0A5N6NMC1_9ASTR|nr:hypothetical protein E3N88_18940 [Mikania micrantha]